MGRMMRAAIERAGLSDVAERALSGKGLDAKDLKRLRKADVLVLAGLADAVREKHRGHEVRVLTVDAASVASDLKLLELDAGRADGATGQELLIEIAVARLTTPAAQGIAVSFEQLGLELAQTALVFGADALVGDLGSRRTLPLLDGPLARRTELTGLIERTGRTARFDDEDAVTAARLAEQRS
jgi:2-iminoacetate synthase ThiH